MPIDSRLNMHDWIDRVRITLACRDADILPRAPNAGGFTEVDGIACQVMHNGSLVVKDCYYSEHMTDIIRYLKGVHEPQEERCFFEVLKHISPKSTMIELGSYWGYYSLWFARSVPEAKCHLIELDSVQLEVGIENFRLNGASGIFTHAGIGKADFPAHGSTSVGSYLRASGDGAVYDGSRRVPGIERNVPLITVENYMNDNCIEHCDILHCDIQGEELAMLDGSGPLVHANRIGWLFVSTHHSDEFHKQCLDAANRLGLKIVAEHNTSDSFSGDGLIVARCPSVPGPDEIEISLRTTSIF